MFDFNSIHNRKESDSIKWRKYRGKEIIPMWVADMDFVSPPAVIEALQERVAHGIFGYGYQGKVINVSVVDHLWRTYKWSIQPGWIVWLPGLVCGLNVVCRSVGQPSDRVATTIPVYPPFLSAPGFSQRSLTTTRLDPSADGWKFNFSDVADVLTGQTNLFVLCNPHNPTGRVFTQLELNRLAEICLRNEVVICSDEIHCDLVLEPGCHHIPLATLSPEIANHTITLMAPSKTYNIPGLSCAFAVISNKRLRQRFKDAMAGIVPHVNVLGMAATQAAYQNGASWLAELRDYLRGNRDLVYQFVQRSNGLEMSKIEATYLAWINTEALNVANPIQLFEKHGVGLSDGTEFNGPGFVRLNFGCSRDVLTKALEQMTLAVQSCP